MQQQQQQQQLKQQQQQQGWQQKQQRGDRAAPAGAPPVKAQGRWWGRTQRCTRLARRLTLVMLQISEPHSDR